MRFNKSIEMFSESMDLDFLKEYYSEKYTELVEKHQPQTNEDYRFIQQKLTNYHICKTFKEALENEDVETLQNLIFKKIKDY